MRSIRARAFESTPGQLYWRRLEPAISNTRGGPSLWAWAGELGAGVGMAVDRLAGNACQGRGRHFSGASSIPLDAQQHPIGGAGARGRVEVQALDRQRLVLGGGAASRGAPLE